MSTRTTPAFGAPTHATPRRLSGLDGLRAIAVGFVLVYHLFPTALPGGFLGVDVFFVISGFLITTLLLDERRRKGYFSLVAFWQRRARRLLPALALVLLVSTSAALLTRDKDLLVNIGAQLAGATAFVANWVYIALGSDYFAQDNPELFRNTWSLAIEEQFYLLLPLLMLFAMRMNSRATRTFFFAMLGLASAWWMLTLSQQGEPATRIYFGTDTHSFGLLFGVALACAVPPWGANAVRGDGLTRSLAVWQQLALLLIGASALAGLGWLTFTLREASTESFAGGFQLATALVLVAIWAATRKGSWLGLALDVQPLRWIGERSYGIYLWHWPLLLLAAATANRVRGELGLGTSQAASKHASLPDSLNPYASAPWIFLLEPWAISLIVLLLTLLLAALSYRFVEQPIRRTGLRASLALLVKPVRLRARRLAVALSVLALLLVTVPATGVAVATAPARSSSADAIARGQAALEAQFAQQDPFLPSEPLAKPQPGDSPVPPEAPVTDAAGDAVSGSDFDPDWVSEPSYEAPPPVPIEGWEIFAVGDSVMLASYPELAAAFADIRVDASVSRGLTAGVDIVEKLERAGKLRPVIVVGLGTNGPIQDRDLNRLLRVADGRRIVLVNAYADRWWTKGVNKQLRDFADAHRGVVLADWAGVIVTVPGGLAGDDVHPNPSGGRAYAKAVQAALDALIEPDELPERRRLF